MSSKTAEKYSLQVKGERKLQWVRLSLMKVNLVAQRDFDQKWADDLFNQFDLDKMQTPHVNHRDGSFHIMDGQHTIAALKRYLGKWEDQTVECWVYEGLSDDEEAEKYLSLNNFKSASLFQKFKIALRAGRETEIAIACIVNNAGLVISQDDIPGKIAAVGTLKRSYKRDGPLALGKSLALIKESFGDAGFEAKIIDGFGLVCNRYNGVLDERNAAIALANMNGGVKGLLNMAEQLHVKTGQLKYQCVAAAAVNVINRSRTRKSKLASWFKE